MADVLIEASRNPLARGFPPEWASEWGEDPYGVFVAFTLDGITQRLRWIPPGRFLMGSPEDETRDFAEAGLDRQWLEREHPQHGVLIKRGFWLFDTPCTQALWEVVVGENPSRFRTPERPVERVSWVNVQTFIALINARIPGLELSLPTEAQWEYACRAGTETALYTGPTEILGENNAPSLDPIAWYSGNSGVDFELSNGYDSSDWAEQQYPNPRAGTHPVGKKQPNPWGLYDMLGNVWEWTQDTFHESYEGASIEGLAWDSTKGGAGRVIRGGSWLGVPGYCRSAFRGWFGADLRDYDLGFRCARVHS